jgi:hypothetical protein
MKVMVVIRSKWLWRALLKAEAVVFLLLSVVVAKIPPLPPVFGVGAEAVVAHHPLVQLQLMAVTAVQGPVLETQQRGHNQAVPGAVVEVAVILELAVLDELS